jgi:nucleoside-diphosphate-sugar epimerase
MKVGITGVNGFLGEEVSKGLNDLGHLVVPLDSFTRKEFSALKIQESNLSDLDWVLHFGSKTSIPDSQNDPFSTYASNISSTLSALKIAEKTKACFLFMSSFVYGSHHYVPIDEKHPISASNPYMSSKIISEEICTHITKNNNVPLIILRGFNIYGSKLIPGRLISDLIISKHNNEILSINDSNPKRDYLYIKDFVGLIEKIINIVPIIPGIYNVGYGQSYTNLEVANIFRELIGEIRMVQINNKKRGNDILDCSVDTQLIKRTFSWSPQYSLKQGLSDFLLL